METVPAAQETLSLWSLTMDGGYLMIPLALLLIVSIYIFIERCIAVGRASKTDKTFMAGIPQYLKQQTIRPDEHAHRDFFMD